ncbi:MAG: YbaB/EbfC DNA-binding family [Actinomycetota bacterium]
MADDFDLDEMLASLQRDRETYADAQRTIDSVLAHALSADRTVRVSVYGSGVLAGVSISPDAFCGDARDDASRVERGILEAYAAASHNAGEQIARRLPGMFAADDAVTEGPRRAHSSPAELHGHQPTSGVEAAVAAWTSR